MLMLKRVKYSTALKSRPVWQLSNFVWTALFAVNKYITNETKSELLDDDSLEVVYSVSKNLDRLGFMNQKFSGDNFICLLHEGLSYIYAIFVNEIKNEEWLRTELKNFVSKRYPHITDERLNRLVFDSQEISKGIDKKVSSKAGSQKHKGGPIEAAYYGVAKFHGANTVTTSKKWLAKWRDAPNSPRYNPLTQNELQSILSGILSFQQVERYGKDRLDYPNSTSLERQTRVSKAIKSDFKFLVEALEGKHQYIEINGASQARHNYGLNELKAQAEVYMKRYAKKKKS